MRSSFALPFCSLLLLLSACAAPSASTGPTDPPTPSASTVLPAPPAPKASAVAPAASAEAPAPDPNLCVLGPNAALGACVGKLVEIRGQAPKFVNQHPNVAPPSFGGRPAIHQGYVETDGGSQIIVLSAEPVTCKDKMRVKGTLGAIDLGGKEGTKDSYKGYSLSNAVVVCE